MDNSEFLGINKADLTNGVVIDPKFQENLY